jgi:hypothetical protein
LQSHTIEVNFLVVYFSPYAAATLSM